MRTRSAVVIALVMFLSITCGLGQTESSGIQLKCAQWLKLTEKGSSVALTNAIAASAKGLIDPFVLIQTVGRTGDVHVLELVRISLEDPTVVDQDLNCTGSTDSTKTAGSLGVASMRLAIHSLEGISTPRAFAGLLLVAGKSRNAELRGLALNALVAIHPYISQKTGFRPDSAVIKLMMEALDDTTFIPELFKRTGQVAYDGVKTWLGKDIGEPFLNHVRASADRATKIQQFHARWWATFGSRLHWNSETASSNLQM